MWMLFACGSALFAGLTAVLAKCGIQRTDSDVATALRTAVVLLAAWGMAWLTGTIAPLTDYSAQTLLFLLLSGLATGASWLCYFQALARGTLGQVVPVDKSSIILTMLFAALFLGETERPLLRWGLVVLLGLGTWWMVTPQAKGKRASAGRGWFVYALLSAVFAALTTIFAKVGMQGIPSNYGTALRTSVVLVLAIVVVLVKGKAKLFFTIPRKEIWFLLLSGLATGASWLCYYQALQSGPVSVVVPIDKLSILVTIAFARLFLRERLSRRAQAGLLLVVVATIGLAVFL